MKTFKEFEFIYKHAAYHAEVINGVEDANPFIIGVWRNGRIRKYCFNVDDKFAIFIWYNRRTRRIVKSGYTPFDDVCTVASFWDVYWNHSGYNIAVNSGKYL